MALTYDRQLQRQLHHRHVATDIDGLTGVISGLLDTALIENEVPSGAIDNVNKVFTTANNFAPLSIAVYYNGLRQKIGAGYDYTETGTNQITFTRAPRPNSQVIVDYVLA